MNNASKSSTPLLHIFGFLLSCFITVAVVLPVDNSILRLFSANAIPVLFIFLALGVVGFVVRNDAMVLINSLACMAICMHVKDTSNTVFSYHTKTSDSLSVSVAHFVVEGGGDMEDLRTYLLDSKADLVSIQVPVEKVSEELFLSDFKGGFSHQHKTICGDSLAIVVLASNRIANLDTLCYDNTISLVGSIFVPRLKKDIAFLSTHVPSSTSKIAEKQLAMLSSYIQDNLSQKPLLALSGSELSSWMPELKSFRRVNSLHDSRIDINWSGSDKHVFYSEDLVCTSFKTICNGTGVLATYQLKPEISNTQITAVGL